jgi:hypothetical protein
MMGVGKNPIQVFSISPHDPIRCIRPSNGSISTLGKVNSVCVMRCPLNPAVAALAFSAVGHSSSGGVNNDDD